MNDETAAAGDGGPAAMPMNADRFGATVVAAMGERPEFGEHPSLRSALAYSVAFAHADAEWGDYGPRESVTAALFCERVQEIVDETISRNDNLGDVGWPNCQIRAVFLAAVAGEFNRFKGEQS
jgi:hypothetical protein